MSCATNSWKSWCFDFQPTLCCHTIWWGMKNHMSFLGHQKMGPWSAEGAAGRGEVWQQWEHLPHTSVAWVRFLDLASYVGWIFCWFSPCLESFAPGSLVFPSPQKPSPIWSRIRSHKLVARLLISITNTKTLLGSYTGVVIPNQPH